MVKRRHKNQDATNNGNDADEDTGWRSDPRFGHLATDPRYRSASARKATRFQIDSRFKAMFTDPDFTTEVKSDKRGRPVAMSSRHDLSRFYGLKEDEDEAEAEDEQEKVIASEGSGEEDSEGEKEPSDEGEEIADQEEEEDDDDEDESDDNDDEAGDDEQKDSESNTDDEEFLELKRSAAADSLNDAETSVKPTNRLAVTQQDWDQLKATDLYMLLGSRCQAAQGRLLSVTVYPSRFGLRRMEAEAEKGPLELATAAAKKSSSAKADPVASDTAYRRSMLRHQQKRLWYYYAVAEFDTVEAAASVYDQCYGLEIECTGCSLRLSYVPKGMQFGGSDDVPAKWQHLVTKCSGIDPAAYKPAKFTTASLGRTRVDITWDETPAERTRYLQGLFGKEDFTEADHDLKRLSEFLAMSSSEDEDAGNVKGKATAAAAAAKRRALLGLNDDADPSAGGDVAVFSDDELPDDIAMATVAVPTAAADAPATPAAVSHKRSRRRRLREQAKRAKLTKAGLLPASADDGSSDDGEDASDAVAKMPASEQELAMLVADRPLGQPGSKGRVTAADVASDARFGALFSDPSYHVDPTHSEAAKAADVQRLIVSAKRRAAMDAP